MKKILAMLLAAALLAVAGCGSDDTDIKSSGNTIAKKIGASGTVKLPPNHKLLEVTYKGDDMWLLYRPMREDEFPEHYIFQEDSKWGFLEGTVRIIESREPAK